MSLCRILRSSPGLGGALAGALCFTAGGAPPVHGAEPPASPQSTTTAAAPSSLGPLSIDEAIETALRHHPQLAAARGTEAAAAARIGQARAPWLPQIGVSAQLRDEYAYQTGLPEPTCTPDQPTCSARQPDTNTGRYSGQLSLSQLLYDFGRTSGRIDAAKAGAAASRGDRQNTEAQTALGAITAYYAVLQAEALFEVAQQSLRQQEQRLRQAESFVAIGTRPEIDALTARTGRAQAELQVVQSKNAALLARVQLLQALGVLDGAWLGRPLQAAPPAPVPGEGRDVDNLLEGVLSGRPDYQALKGRVAQAEAQARATRADYLPQLSLSGGAGLSGTFGGFSIGTVGGVQRTDLPTAGQPGFSLSAALQVSWSPLTGLSTRYAVREAEALSLVARANLEVLRQAVRSGLQQALFNVQNSQQAALSAEAVRAQAERQLAVATGRYEAGVGNIIELGDAQVGATQARAQRVQADYNLALARAGLRLQLGQLTPKETSR